MYRFLWQHEGIIFKDNIKCTETQRHSTHTLQITHRCSSSNPHQLCDLIKYLAGPTADLSIRAEYGCSVSTLLHVTRQRRFWRDLRSAFELLASSEVWRMSLMFLFWDTQILLLGSWTLWGRCKRAAQAGTVLSPNSILVQMQQKLCSA